MHSDDLLSISDAAKLSERSSSTIRRWIRDGKLTGHDGGAPAHGGSARVLVRRGDLTGLLAQSGQTPRSTGDSAPVHEVVETPGVADLSTVVQLMELRFDVERVKLTHQADTARLRLAHALEQLNESKRETVTEREEGHLMRLERDDWRNRHDALAAELKAMRQASGNRQTWWQKLLGGPAELPDFEN